MPRFRSFLFAALVAFPAPALAAIQSNAEHAILMDGDTGQVLWAKSAYVPMAPASMSKLMSLELLFERLKDGRVKLTDTFPVSERAWRTQGSKSFMVLGSRVAVQDLIRGVVIQSGNDACIVIAEALGGTVEGFVQMMNARAKALGYTQSHFVNPDGLPDPPGQLMSAYDLARLARHLIRDYPQYYHYFGEKSFTWDKIEQPNRNLVLEKFPGADGLKTGHTDLAGYGITSSAVQNGQRMILVLNGLRYPDAKNDYFPNIYRADEAARILGIAFREFRSYPIVRPGQVLGTARVEGGSKDRVALSATPLALKMQVDSHAGMRIALHADADLRAPVHQGEKVGTLTVTAPDLPPATVPVYAAESVPRTGLVGRVWDKTWSMLRRK